MWILEISDHFISINLIIPLAKAYGFSLSCPCFPLRLMYIFPIVPSWPPIYALQIVSPISAFSAERKVALSLHVYGLLWAVHVLVLCSPPNADGYDLACHSLSWCLAFFYSKLYVPVTMIHTIRHNDRPFTLVLNGEWSQKRKKENYPSIWIEPITILNEIKLFFTKPRNYVSAFNTWRLGTREKCIELMHFCILSSF